MHPSDLRGVLAKIGICLLALWASSSAFADGTGWFSATQVESGRLEFAAKCQTCHGAQLQGTGAPALKGRPFSLQWNGKTLGAFYSYVHKEMPLGNPESLKRQEYADIVAFVLSQNGLPAGDEKLTPASPMNRVLTLEAGVSTPQAGAPAAPVKLGELTGPVKQPTTSGPTQAQLDAADADTQSWLMYNKGYRGERYAGLSRVDKRNANRLRPVCMFQLGELGTFQTGPVVYDNVLYATTHLGTYAIDAVTCTKLWSHQHLAQGAEMNATNKGIAIAGGRVIRGTQDGFLYALDAKTGDLLWERQIQDPSIGAGVGAAPIVWNGMIFMGNAGGDWGIRGAMMAFRLETERRSGRSIPRRPATSRARRRGNDPAPHCTAAARPGPLMRSIANRERCSSRSAIPARTTIVRLGPVRISLPVRLSRWTRAPAN
jgi:mono/diheme cytochrome c family protein